MPPRPKISNLESHISNSKSESDHPHSAIRNPQSANNLFRIPRSAFHISSAVAALIAFLIYLATAAPGAWWGDGPELACAAWTLGIPHPTGYPLYMLAGHAAMKLLGWLDPGRALTLFSALLTAASIGLLVSLFRRVIILNAECGMRNVEPTGSADVPSAPPSANSLSPLPDNPQSAIQVRRPGGPSRPQSNIPHSTFRIPHFLPTLGAALLLAFSRTLWDHATFAEVYPLTFFIGVLLLRVAWIPSSAAFPGPGRAATLGALLGLGLLNHYSILALAPLAAFCVLRWTLRADRAPWRLPLAAAACCAVMLLGYLYLPLRAAVNPPLNWGDPSTLDRLRWVLSGGQFKDIMVKSGPDAALQGLAQWLAWWGAQWAGVDWASISLGLLSPVRLALLQWSGALLVAAAVAGLVILARRRWELGLGLLGALAATAAYAAFYHIVDIAPYYMIALPAAMIGWIVLIQSIFHSSFRVPHSPFDHSALFSVVPLLAAFALLLNQYVDLDKSWDDVPLRYGETVLEALPQGALVVTAQGAPGDAEIYALWYQQMVLGRRPDVTVFGSGFMFLDWYARYFERPERPRIPVYVEAHPISTETYYFVKFYRGILLPNLAQGRRVFVTFQHPLLAEYLDPRPVAGLLSPAYIQTSQFPFLPGPVLYELHANPGLAALDEAQLTAEFDRFLLRRQRQF